MSITRSRVLVSYKINVETSTIEIEHADRVVEDGAVIASNSHRGAYELVNGDLPDYIREEFDISVASLASEALLSFTRTNADLRGAIGALEAQCNKINADRELLVSCVDQLTTEKDVLLEKLTKKETEIQELNIQVQGLERAPVEEVGAVTRE